METSKAGSLYDYTIRVQTGDRPRAGTDANVYVILHGVDGQSSQKTKLDCFFHDDFERGQLDTFKVKGQKVTSQIFQVFRASSNYWI